jgi:hypothetical protein
MLSDQLLILLIFVLFSLENTIKNLILQWNRLPGTTPLFISFINLTVMKKILIALSLALTVNIMAGARAYPQNSRKNIESDNGLNFMPSIYNLSILQNRNLAGVNLLARNEINIWAVRDFVIRFEDVENVLWFAIPKGGYEAYFVRDGYGERIIYDKSGGWQQSLLNYDEDKCPRDIRAAIKSLFFDFEIILIEEVDNREGVEYIFYLQDKSSIRIVKVNKENIVEELLAFNKQGN